MNNKIEIYKSPENLIEVQVDFEQETVWLSQKQIALIYGTEVPAINKHIKNIIKEGELQASSTISKMEIVQIEGKRKINRNVDVYNLDMIISIGYRVNSARATQFRQWATQRLKDYLVQGYAINEKRLQQKQQEVEYLKTGIRILNRAIEEKLEETDSEMLQLFANGLLLLDDYDHELLDKKGLTEKEAEYPEYNDYMTLIREMYSDFESDVFAQPKDESFHSSINQIRQSFGGLELYPSIEEKAANLLYLIVKNHSFVDGNKRIGAACFLYFLKQNHLLINKDGNPIISNEALAALTLFIATSKTEEKESVTRLIISILNRNN